MALKKSEIKPPVLKKEAVPVASLGGEVVVRALKLSERLALFSNRDEGGQVYAHIAELLAVAVVDADGMPIWSSDDWDVWAAGHVDESLALFERAKALSGLDAEVVAKN